MATIHKEKHSRRATAAVAIALCAGVSQLAFGQDAKGLNIDVESCVALETPEQRLACFEAQVEAARQRAAAPSASEATGASTAAVTGASTPAVAGASTPAVAEASGAAVAGASTAAVAAPSTAAVVGPSTATITGATTASPGTAPAVSQKSASEPRSAENFGFPEPPPEPPPQRKPERQPVEIVATVTELRLLVPNAYLITLDNGQVWQQPHPMPYPLRTGLVVRVRETRLGYRLTAPELHGQINVERVR